MSCQNFEMLYLLQTNWFVPIQIMKILDLHLVSTKCVNVVTRSYKIETTLFVYFNDIQFIYLTNSGYM